MGAEQALSVNMKVTPSLPLRFRIDAVAAAMYDGRHENWNRI